MQESIIQIMNDWGYFGIILLIAAENIFPPIPSEVILTLGGFMTTFTDLTLPGVILSSTLGSVVGAVVLYALGRCLSRDRLIRWVNGKAGKLLRLKQSDIEKADRWFSRRGKRTVFLCRFIPVVRSLISIPAGMNKMPFGIFLFFTALGTALWNTVLCTLGHFVGDRWVVISDLLGKYSAFTVIILVLLLVTGIVIFYRRRSTKKAVKKETHEPQEDKE